MRGCLSQHRFINRESGVKAITLMKDANPGIRRKGKGKRQRRRGASIKESQVCVQPQGDTK
jgi:hypothetical protein